MAILLDTCVLIDVESADLSEHGDVPLVLSAVTIAELAYGADHGDADERDARQKRLAYALREYEILPFGVEEAKLYGVLATLVRVAGRNPRPRRLDLQIAATAAAARVPLLTANPDDFVGIDRLVEIVPVERGRRLPREDSLS